MVFFVWVILFTQDGLGSTYTADLVATRVLVHLGRREWDTDRNQNLLAKGGSASSLPQLVDGGFRCVLAFCFRHATFDISRLLFQYAIALVFYLLNCSWCCITNCSVELIVIGNNCL